MFVGMVLIPVLYVCFAVLCKRFTGVAIIGSSEDAEGDEGDAEELGQLLLSDDAPPTKGGHSATRSSIMNVVTANLTVWSFLQLAIPAGFDLVATFLTNVRAERERERVGEAALWLYRNSLFTSTRLCPLSWRYSTSLRRSRLFCARPRSSSPR